MASLYSVTYNTNNSTGGTTPATQTAETNSPTYSFATPQQDDLLKTNYIFVGWSEDPNAIIAQYIPGETITLTSNNPNKTLYATWVSLAPTTWSELYYMQQMNPTACSSATESTNSDNQKQLIDSRDGKRYWVAKLADGNCWMTQNLDYDDPEGTRRIGDTKPDSWPNNDIRQYWDPGEKIVSGSTLVAASDDTDRHLLVGNYYSWLSATNGTGSDVTTNGGNASGSICPEGWRLPTSNTTGEFQALVNKGKSGWVNYPNTNIPGYWLGGTSATASGAAFFSANGLVSNGSLGSAGSEGRYWSSTSCSATKAYFLYFYSGNVVPSNNLDRYYGFSVRCVAR